MTTRRGEAKPSGGGFNGRVGEMDGGRVVGWGAIKKLN